MVGLIAVCGVAMGRPDSARDAERESATAGPTLTITHCEASVKVYLAQTPKTKRTVSRDFQVIARLDIPGASAPAWCENFEIVELRDAAGKDLLAGKNRQREPDSYRRSNLAQQLVNQYTNERTVNTTVMDSVRNLKELPQQLSVIKTRAQLAISRKPTLVKVPLKVTAEPMPLVPGVTVLVTKIEEQNKTVSVGLEVRSRTPAKVGDAAAKPDADLELARPIFAGIVMRNKDGKIGGVMPMGQTVELHDESIVLVQSMPIPEAYLTSDGSLEVLVFDQMDRVVVDSTIENVELAVGGEPPKE